MLKVAGKTIIASHTLTGNLGTDFIMRPWDTSAVQGETVVLFCAVNGTDSERNPPTVTWLKSGSTINTR